MRSFVGALVLLAAIFGIGLFVLRFDSQTGNEAVSVKEDIQFEDMGQKEKKYPRYREITEPTGYVNSDGITLGDLIGKKVILLDIMTYSCINCQRTYPFLNAWYEKYKDHGLEIVGIHTPEFAFEKDIENVREAMGRYGITFPVVLDNDYGTWRAYGNRYWPRKYLIDIDGFVVYDHIGEGAYDETEKKIQELLSERKERLSEEGEIQKDMVELDDVEFPHDGIRSPETYFGLLRQRYDGFDVSGMDEITSFEEPDEVLPNRLYLVGDWKLTPEYAQAASENAKIVFRYFSRKVFLVADADEETEALILRDGEPVEDVAGEHVDDSIVRFQNEQLYRLIEDEDRADDHILEIQFEKPGVRAYAFTFG